VPHQTYSYDAVNIKYPVHCDFIYLYFTIFKPEDSGTSPHMPGELSVIEQQNVMCMTVKHKTVLGVVYTSIY